jgi:iron complex transport system substrate-binding protein
MIPTPRRRARPSRRLAAILPVLAFVLAARTGAVAPTTPAASSVGSSVAPSTATPSPEPTYPVTLMDDEGTAVAIPARPAHIVSLTPATTEILFALGAGDRVVAKVEDVADYPAEAHDVPVVATYAGVDIEKIVAAGADLVISGGAGLSQGDAVEKLRAAGIPVLVLYPTSVAGALAGIRATAVAIGEPAAGEALAASMQAEIDALAAAVAGQARPRTFYEIDATGGIFTPPADSIYGEMLTLAGASPIAGDAAYSISLEQLVTADPEVILLGDSAYGMTADQVAARPGWGGMAAVTAGRIIPVDDIVITRPGPRLVAGLRALIAAIHPDVVLPTAAG